MSAMSELPQPSERRRREAWSWGFVPSSSIKHSRMGGKGVGWHARVTGGGDLSQ